MTHTAPRIPVLLLLIVGSFCSIQGQSIDPRSPQEWRARQLQETRELKKWLPARIRQLEAERDQLIAKINTLPQHEPTPLTRDFGYHSLRGIPDNIAENKFQYVTADIIFNQDLNSIGLVPALNPFDPPNLTYAFPKRFKIEILEGSGRIENGIWVRNPDPAEWTEVVNWMDEDFPDPGPYPVVFSDINVSISKVRVVVPTSGQDSKTEFFALGELYLFRGQDGEIADNMATFGTTGITFDASDSLSIKSAWDLDYLYDGVSVLGLPLSEKTSDVDDFIIKLDNNGGSQQPLRIVLDLGEVQRIGRIELWPAKAPKNMAIPLFGFPGSVMAELSVQPDFSDAWVVEVPNAREQVHSDNLLTLICVGHNARYIRLTFEKLSDYLNHPMLALGEISVLEFGKIFSTGCKVDAEGIPDDYLNQLPLLVDGFSRQRRILPESDWIIGLAQRRPLDARLNAVEKQLTLAREDWRTLLFRLSIYGGIALLLLMVFGWTILRNQRAQELEKLRLQITRDLHDEVGSSLGSISLASEQLEGMVQEVVIKEELSELSLMAREANASLLEVVWVTDQETIYLSALIEKLVERAEKVLRNVEVVSDIAPHFPEIKVNLTAKRHVILFFKEAIHNCARHAFATRATISAGINIKNLGISIHDNGRGFDLSQSQTGWGLDSMGKRAKELGGTLEITSAPAKGTTIKLEVPLTNLSLNPALPYNTSN